MRRRKGARAMIKTLATFVDGRSLRPLFASDVSTWRTAFLHEFFAKGTKRRHKAVITASGKKYVEYERGEEELYDLNEDPYELESQHDIDDVALLESLRTRSDALFECAGESCRTAEDGPQPK